MHAASSLWGQLFAGASSLLSFSCLGFSCKLTWPLALQVLHADGLLYQSIQDLFAVAQELNPNVKQFEASCFTGELCQTCMCISFVSLLPSPLDVVSRLMEIPSLKALTAMQASMSQVTLSRSTC